MFKISPLYTVYILFCLNIKYLNYAILTTGNTSNVLSSFTSFHFTVISWATICCILMKVSNFSHTCDKTTLDAVTHAHTHTRDIQTTHTLSSGIISTCTTCTSIDKSDHIATSNGLRFAPPSYSPLTVTPFAAPQSCSPSAFPLFFLQ